MSPSENGAFFNCTGCRPWFFLILTALLWGRNCYTLHFLDEEIYHRRSNMYKFTWLGSTEPGLWCSSDWSRTQALKYSTKRLLRKWGQHIPIYFIFLVINFLKIPLLWGAHGWKHWQLNLWYLWRYTEIVTCTNVHKFLQRFMHKSSFIIIEPTVIYRQMYYRLNHFTGNIIFFTEILLYNRTIIISCPYSYWLWKEIK